MKVRYFGHIENYPLAGGVCQFSTTLRNALGRRADVRLKEIGVDGPTRMPRFFQETIAACLPTRCDIDFFPNYFVPPRLVGRAFPVTTVHDIQHTKLPELFTRRRRQWLDLCYSRLTKIKCGVVFISEASRSDFLNHYGEPLRHEVIYNSVELPEAGLAKDGIAPFILASYHFYPHKNFEGILRLFKSLLDVHFCGNLLITGHGQSRVNELLEKHPEFSGRVEHLGFVKREDLEGLYRGCSAFVSLSRFEGFNLSAAEAAALGAKLVLSDIPVHRELFGSVAHFVDLAQPNYTAASNFIVTGGATQRWDMAKKLTPALQSASYVRFFQSCTEG